MFPHLPRSLLTRPVAALAALLALFFSGCATTPSSRPGPSTPPVVDRPVTPAATNPSTTSTLSPPATTPIVPRAAAPKSDPTPVPSQKSVPNLAPPTVQTAPAADARPATIVGFEESSAMLDNLTAFITSVDGHRLSAGRTGWNTPVSIKPGSHVIVVEFNRGVFAAQASLHLNAQPGAAYQVRFASDAQLFGKNSFCEFWIEDLGTHEKILAPVRSPLNRVEPAN